MANYVDKNAGDPWLAGDGNALADDIGSPTTGHQHDGSNGHGTLLPDAIGDGASITWDGRVLFDKGGDLASGSTLTIGTDGNFFDVTGTTTITAFSSLQAGTLIFLQFDAVVLLTYNATSLILEGAVNRTTEAKDIYGFVSLGSGNWQEICRSTVTPAAAHTIASHSDTTITGAQINHVEGWEATLSSASAAVSWASSFVSQPAVTMTQGSNNSTERYVSARSTTGATVNGPDVECFGLATEITDV